MKKLLVALLALACVAGFAFADGTAAPAAPAPVMTWTGAFGSGLALDSTSAGTNVTEFSPDIWYTDRLRLSGNFTDPSGNYGFHVRFQMNPFAAAKTVLTATTTTTTTLTGTGPGTSAASTSVTNLTNASLKLGQFVAINQLDAWAKFLNGMVTVKAGELDGYEVAGPIWDDYGMSDTHTGVWVQVNPVDGLTVGYMLPATPTATGISTSFWTGMGGFMYTNKAFGSVNGGIDWTNVEGMPNPGPIGFWGLNITAVKNLTLQGEGYIPATTDMGPISAMEYAAYQVNEKLNVGAYLSQDIYTNATAFNVFPQVSYTVSDMVTVGLYGDAFAFNDSQELGLFFDPVAYAGAEGLFQAMSGASSDKSTILDSQMVYGAGPYVKFTQGKATVTIGDSYFVLPSDAKQSSENIAYVGVGFGF